MAIIGIDFAKEGFIVDGEIIEKIKSLPPLDETVLKIQKICTNKDSTLAELVSVVKSDPMLTANILKSANSPLYGFSREIKSVSHAVSLFGMATVRGFALSSAVKKNMTTDLSPYGLSEGSFLEISSLQSALMFNWYSKVDRELLDILVPASFMMEVGKVIISHILVERGEGATFYNKIKKLETIEELSMLEMGTFEITNEEIAAKIFAQWNLETELVEAIRYSTNLEDAPEHIKPFSTALKIVKKAINSFSIFEERSIEKAVSLLEENDLKSNIFLNEIEKLRQ